ncbi:MAG: FAD-dependent oxidoreductase [Casimicrobiaceae bacterium]
MNSESVSVHDALVVGGGPAGATAAILLARAGWSVAIVERKPFPRRKVCGEFISATTWPLLADLGVAKSLSERAGPEIRRVGLYAGEAMLAADMPMVPNQREGWGRALGREQLDAVLLARAKETGAEVLQPWTLSRIERTADGYLGSGIGLQRGGGAAEPAAVALRARIVIAAHGSWEPGSLPTQFSRHPPRASDLFAFKAHFSNGKLPLGLMPLLLFPDGYGGMVQADAGRASLSCCIRRDALERCRRRYGNAEEHARAAEAVFAHIHASCRGVREALKGATLDGAWLSAGPIRPGIRPVARQGIFAVGNAAGEAHPIVAEGISMAIQSAWLLCEQLVARRGAALAADADASLAAIGSEYERRWRSQFGTRIRAAALFAHLGMRPATAKLIVALSQRTPAILSYGARWSGKTRSLSGPANVDAA